MSRAGRVRPSFVLTLILLLSAVFFGSAARASFLGTPQELSPEEKLKVIERFRSLHKDTKSIFANVSQEKRSAALRKKVIVQGTVLMSRPNMLRWDVMKPERSVTVIDGENMTVYHPDIKEAQVYALSDHLIAKNTMGFFSTAMNGDLREMEEKFRVTVFRREGEIDFRLVPLSGIVRRYLQSVVIHYDEATGLPTGFETSTSKGDKTVTRLANIKVNPEIKPDAFRMRLPADVWITNRTESGNN